MKRRSWRKTGLTVVSLSLITGGSQLASTIIRRAHHLTQELPKSSSEWPGLFLYYPKRAAFVPKLQVFYRHNKSSLATPR
jgi:hypothetical protein